MTIITITSAEELFLDDVSAEDYQELVAEHEETCKCTECQVFNRLLQLEQEYFRYLQGLPVDKQLAALMQEKFDRYQ